MTSDLTKRKHPVHLPNLQRHNEPVIIFLTVCTHDRRPRLANAAIEEMLVKAWGLSRQWRVGRYLVMPDHLHLFCSPAVQEAENVKDWATYWKGLVSRGIQGYGPCAANSEGRGDLPIMGGNGSRGSEPSRRDEEVGGRGATRAEDGDGSRGSGPSRGDDVGGGRGATRAERFWQRDVWDTQLRSGNHYHEKWDYVRMNPVRQALVNKPDAWPFQGELNVLWW
jgi:REP element-mobilizing transposase RayT